MNALKARAVADDPSIGAWHIESDDCPLEFTGDRPPCVVGIMTNIQGSVILKYCQHCNKDSNFRGPSGVQVECHAAQPTRDTLTGDMFGDSGEG